MSLKPPADIVQTLEEGLPVTLKGIHQYLDECPLDWSSRLILADMYADRGEALLEAGQRWQVRRKKRPREHEGKWCWWCVKWYKDYTDSLPGRVGKHLSCREICSTGTVHVYSTRQAAEEDLAQALLKAGEVVQ